ncbi:MAG: GNAT family N-acetyltransferase [Candidatus Saccharimonas aalborgensis]|jgi:GNAT superfamily N-acetyltransferase|nr:GNAT family N-acetyltransferase [Candidatus Saccharimonas sp.]QQS70272.1 MAG: GNAT family N-acetyltransferase [Candidatus Saccharibacteria bacterium]
MGEVMEKQQAPHFNVSPLTLELSDEANAMRLQSWLDTYVNESEGVTREWIESRNQRQTTNEARKRRIERLNNPHTMAWVALDENGGVIGMTSPYIDDEGTQHVGSLYVEQGWHGKGVGAALMQKVIDWFDPRKPIELGVVNYNERAKAFYRKWGFEEVPGSKTLLDSKIPEVKMIRKGDDQDEV